MAKYTTRVELRDAGPADYEKLNAAMLEAGFTTSLRSEDGSVFILPAGEFNKDIKAGIKEVYQLAEKAANSTGKKNWILTTEAINRMWKLQEVLD